MDGEALGTIRRGVGEWLQSDVPNQLVRDGDTPQTAASERIGALATHLLRQYPNEVRLFDLHTTDALLEAARVREEEIAGGAQPAASPRLSPNAEHAMPILRYVPEDQRAALLQGTPDYIAALGRQPEAAADQTAERGNVARRIFRKLVGRWMKESRAGAVVDAHGAPEATSDPLTASNLSAAAERRRQGLEDAAVRERLDMVKAFVDASGKYPTGIDFFLCADPEEIGVSHDALARMERNGYENSGYGERAEGKQLFADAFRGFRPEDRLGDLRFVIVTHTDEASGVRTPVAFFDYFQVGHNLFPEVTEAAAGFVEANGLQPEPARYIVSKLVADPARAMEMRDLHRYALVGTLSALAGRHENGLFMETQAQPATRRMVRRHGETYMPGLQILLDEPLPDDGRGKGERSKLLLYIPSPEA
ncbi:MAG TPA: hypothetical protein VF466_00430 [Candidatus Saccharimonadales bacterium]